MIDPAEVIRDVIESGVWSEFRGEGVPSRGSRGNPATGAGLGHPTADWRTEIDPGVRAAYPASSRSGALIGSVSVTPSTRPTALRTFDGEAVIADPAGTRRVPFATFSTPRSRERDP